MIIKNEFKEFEEIARKIDEKLYYVNMDIRRLPKDETPRNESGIIYINDRGNEEYFAGELAHEAGHSIFTPITTYNHINIAYRIKDELKVDDDTAILLANIASDVIVEYKLSSDKMLSELRGKSILIIYNEVKEQMTDIQKELLGIYNKFHNLNLNVESKIYDEVVKVINSSMDNVDKHVEIAKLFYQFVGVDKIKEFKDVDVKANEEELEKVIHQIGEDSGNIKEMKEKIKLLKLMCNGRKKIDYDNIELLKMFYEAQAKKVRLSIAYPQTITYKGVRIGSKKWRIENGVNRIDVKRTIVKYGVNIPYVTTQTPRILNKFISSEKSGKPIDLVISIDTSDSMGIPKGNLISTAEYEVIMFYALIDLAKKINQRIGLTLWHDAIYCTTLPKVFDYRVMEKLKEIILRAWRGGGTTIKEPLEQAKRYSDKLFFVFTDGMVEFDELIDVDNVVFFLIETPHYSYRKFVEKYGEHRVIVIDNIKDIPKITLQHYTKLFMGG